MIVPVTPGHGSLQDLEVKINFDKSRELNKVPRKTVASSLTYAPNSLV